MNGEEFRKVIAFEYNLKVGDIALARWTNSHRYWSAKVKVDKINAKSFRGALLEALPGDRFGGYPAGFRVFIPRVDELQKWSYNNRLEPPEGYS